MSRINSASASVGAGGRGGFFEPLSGRTDAGKAGGALFHQFPGKVHRVAVVGTQEEQAYRFQVELLSDVPHQQEIAKAFGHLLVVDVDVSVVHPVAGEGLARGRLALGDFVFMVGENQVLATGVDVEGGA